MHLPARRVHCLPRIRGGVIQNRPSRTAEAVCLFRAVESRRPTGTRILDDPHAHAFLTVESRIALQAASTMTWLWERLSLGLPAYVACRHRWIDEQIQLALEHGAEHVLVLGAGYDSRAWRLKRTVPLTELDHPATQARKLGRCEPLPATHRVQRAAIDFESTSLTDCLEGLGWERQNTAVVWEGVSMYLTLAAVQTTLQTLAETCAPGSIVAMDWMAHNDAPTWRGTFDRVAPQVLQLFGEPVTLAVPPQAISGIVEPLGWTVEHIQTAHQLSQLYDIGPRPIYGPGTVSLLRRR